MTYRFAANLSMLFQDHIFLDRIDAAAAAGFDGVECWWPYAEAPAAIAGRLRAGGLEMRMINTPPGPPERGGRGLGAIAGEERRFREGMIEALEYAVALGAAHIHVMSGILPEGADRARARATLEANLAVAASLAGDSGIGLLIEAICPEATPGYFLNSLGLAAEIAGAGGAGILYDDYHATMIGDHLMLDAIAPSMGHVQAASVPGRHEPDIAALLDRLDRAGYRGWVSGEYVPAHGTEAGLAWLETARNWTKS